MTAPVPQPSILKIVPYKGGESTVEGVSRVFKLSSNESALGPSPNAIAAFQTMAQNLHRYPNGHADLLRQALAKHYDLELDRLICGNGSDDLIALVLQAYCPPGSEVVYSQYGFLMYPIATLANEGVPVIAPETDCTANVDALLSKVTDKTRLVFLTNPNNPTGTYLPESEVRRLREKLPGHVLLVLDAAYAEYVSRPDYDSGLKLARERDDVMVMRTFSKIYGLAALRLGWAYAPESVVDVLNRIRPAFNVNGVAQIVGAAALADTAWTDAARRHNDTWLPRVTEQVRGLGFEVVPSVANFILIRFKPGPKDAAAALEFMRRRGLLLRAMTSYGFPDCLRLTIGTEEENMLVLAAFKEFVAA